jgi:predicted HicB family RNase H-like nuclease
VQIKSSQGENEMGKTSAAVKNRYNEKAYDRINLTVAKGKKDSIKAHADKQGESVNAFINRAIEEAMERDNKQ